MKVKMGLLLLTASFIALAAWLVHTPDALHADEVPEKYRDTAKKGLAFLAKHQRKDGHWEGDDGKHPVAMTAFVGIAFLMEMNLDAAVRELFNEKDKHKEHVDKAVAWLIQHSNAERDSLIFSEHASETSRYMEGHGLATMFLVAALRREPHEPRNKEDADRRKPLTDVLERAVKYIAKAQSSRGGWYHTSRTEGHDFDALLPTVIQVQALQAANQAGIPISQDALSSGQEYLRKTVEKHSAKDAPVNKRQRLSDTIRAFPACFNSRRESKSNSQKMEWLTYCREEYPEAHRAKLGLDDLDEFFYAQARYIGGSWTTFRNVRYDQFQAAQDKDGGWPSSTGLGVGRVYATALWCIVLQLENEQYPAIREMPLIRR